MTTGSTTLGGGMNLAMLGQVGGLGLGGDLVPVVLDLDADPRTTPTAAGRGVVAVYGGNLFVHVGDGADTFWLDLSRALTAWPVHGLTLDGTGDNRARIQAVIDAAYAAGGGEVVLPQGLIRCEEKLVLYTGVSLCGQGGLSQASASGTTVILGNHVGEAILTLKGAVGCRVRHLALSGGASVAFPQTGLLLGRSSGGSAGWHQFEDVAIFGRFSVAGLYNVASEGNTYKDLWISLGAGSTAKNGVYMCGGNSGGLTPDTPFVGSSMLGAEFLNCFVDHSTATGADTACVYIDGSVATGSIAFRGGYLTQRNGSFVKIRSGTIDSYETMGGITFDGVGGESPGGSPVAGFNLFATAGDPSAIHGLQIRNCRFQMAAGKYVLQDAYVSLIGAIIESMGHDTTAYPAVRAVASTMGANVFGAVPTPIVHGTNYNCRIDTGVGVPWMPSGATVNGKQVFGNPSLTASDVGADPAGSAAGVTLSGLGGAPAPISAGTWTASGGEGSHDFTGLNSSHRYLLKSSIGTRAGDDILLQPNGSSAGCNCGVWYCPSTAVLYAAYANLMVVGLLSGGSGVCEICPRRAGESAVESTWWEPAGLRNRKYLGTMTTDFTSLRVKASAGTFGAGDTFELWDMGATP